MLNRKQIASGDDEFFYEYDGDNEENKNQQHTQTSFVITPVKFDIFTIRIYHNSCKHNHKKSCKNQLTRRKHIVYNFYAKLRIKPRIPVMI